MYCPAGVISLYEGESQMFGTASRGDGELKRQGVAERRCFMVVSEK